jgi:hypothetical protein
MLRSEEDLQFTSQIGTAPTNDVLSMRTFILAITYHCIGSQLYTAMETELLGGTELPVLRTENTRNNNPFKSFLDISIVQQKLRKAMKSQDASRRFSYDLPGPENARTNRNHTRQQSYTAELP